jgi:hypothetical protein
VSDLFGHQTTIKALSLWQPWASLISAGVKRHETRHWSTTYRGPIAIHASKTLDLAGAPEELCIAVLGKFWSTRLPLGAVVAIGELTRCADACRVKPGLTAADLESGNFATGRFAWAIDRVRPLKEAIPTVGRQGLFNWTLPQDLDERLMPALNHAEAARMVGWA